MKPDVSGLVVATKSNNSSSTGTVLHRTEAGAELLRRGSLEWWGLPLPEQGLPDGALHTALSSSKPGEEPLELKLPSGWWGSSPPPRTGPQTGQLQRGLFGPLRRSVSCSRNRYEWNGFDLDLTYVTSRIIAMGIPGKGLAATYRNPVTEVDRFLRWAHGDSFRIYNLCAEEKHAANGFPGQTVRYPFFDHCPPPLQMMLDFCRDVEAWLRSGEENVAVVHCKAGKGRCGTMACALLVFSGAMPSAYEALRWFARVRGGGKRSGVTIPSQIRWIAMFEHWLRSGPCALGWPGALETAPARGAGRAEAPPPEAHRYRLRTLRLGPIRQALLRPCAGGGGRGETAVLIGIAPREAVTKKRKDLWHWYPEAIIRTVNEGHLEVAFPSGGPLLEESDGVLKVRVRRPQSSTASASRLRGALFRRPPTLEVSTWWSFEFLQRLEERGGSALHLDLPKAYVDGMQGDMRRHKLAPPDFRLRLTTVEERPRRPVGPYGRGGSTSFDATKNIDGAAGVGPRLPLSQQSARRAAAAGGTKPSIRFESVLQKGACGLLGCLLGPSAHKELNPRSP